jgi:hypothetical protein
MLSLVVAAAIPLLAPAADSDERPASVVAVDVSMQATPGAAVVGDDGTHILHQLRLTNYSTRPVTLQRVEVLDGETRQAVGV